MKGVVITADLKMYTKEFGQPLYKSVGDVVGGWVEVVHPRGLGDPFCFICNEEGLIRELPLNAVGSLWYGVLQHGCPIAGNIVVMKEDYVGEELDIVGLTGTEIQEVKAMAMEVCGGMLEDLDEKEAGNEEAEPAADPVMTRADKIRAMSDEELARAMYRFGDAPYCRDLKECGDMLNQDIEIPEEKCIGCALRYLQEVEA